MVGQPIYMLSARGGRLQAHRQARRGSHRDRSGAPGHRDAARARRRRQVRRVLRPGLRRHAAGQPGDDRQHGARVRRHRRLLPGRRADPQLPAAHRPRRGARSRPSSSTTSCRACGATTRARSSTAPTSNSTCRPSRPSLAGPKRPQDRIDLSGMKDQWHYDLAETFHKSAPAGPGTVEEMVDEGGPVLGEPYPDADRRCPGRVRRGDVPAQARCCGHRRHHVVHQHVEPRRDGGSRSRGPQGAGARSDPQAVGEDLARARLEGRHRLPRRRGPDRRPRSAGLLPGRLRVHDLHRQLRSAARARSAPRSTSTTSWSPRCCPATATSRAASRPTSGPTTWRRRRSWLPMRLAGTVDIDLTTEPIGTDDAGTDVYLRDIWPTQAEIDEIVGRSVKTEQFTTEYGAVFEGSEEWRAIPSTGDALYEWNPDSTYVQEPPFFMNLGPEVKPITAISGARVLLKLGDSVTTDHISPAGAIAPDLAGGSLPHRPRRRAADVQQLRLATRQRSGDDPRHVRQHPHPQPARSRHRGWLHHRLHRRRGQDGLRRGAQLPRRPAFRSSCSPARTTAWAPRGTGPPRARSSSASRRSSPPASSGSIAPTW